MKNTDFNREITSAQLLEGLEKQFGTSVNLEKYNREQLEDIRNKFRTKIFQQESNAGINDLLANETYQKDKAVLQLLNTRIKEMLGEDIKKLKDKMIELSEGKKGVKVAKHPRGSKKATKDYDGDGKIESPKDEVWGSRAKAAAKAGTPFKEGFDDMEKAVKAKNEPKPNGGAGKKAGKAYGGSAQKPEKAKDDDKDLDEGFDDMEKAVKAKHEPKPNGGAGKKAGKAYGGSAQKSEKAKDDDKDLDEAAYSAKAGAAGKDLGKPGKNFAKIAKSAGKEYGSKEKGEKVAGAVLKKIRAKHMNENAFKHNVRFINESIGYLLSEDEEGKAKAITAAGDIVNDFTSWMQRVGQYQTKTMIELADAIKADFGAAEAEAFKQMVGPALSSTLEVLTQQREAISGAVAQLAGESVPEVPMGAEPDMGDMPSPEVDVAAPDEMNPEPAGDEFAASDAAAGAGTTGREMRESKFARKLAESHSIISKLAK